MITTVCFILIMQFPLFLSPTVFCITRHCVPMHYKCCYRFLYLLRMFAQFPFLLTSVLYLLSFLCISLYYFYCLLQGYWKGVGQRRHYLPTSVLFNFPALTLQRLFINFEASWPCLLTMRQPSWLSHQIGHIARTDMFSATVEITF